MVCKTYASREIPFCRASSVRRSTTSGGQSSWTVIRVPVPSLQLQSAAVRRRQRELGAILQNHRVRAFEQRLQLPDPIEIHYVAAMNADEPGRVERSFQMVHGVAVQIGLRAHMQPDV